MLVLRTHMAARHLRGDEASFHLVAHRDDGFARELLLRGVGEVIDEHVLAHRTFVVACPQHVDILSLEHERRVHDQHKVLRHEDIVPACVQACARFLICIRAIETDLPRQLLAHEPLANRLAVFCPITQKRCLTRRLDTHQRLRLGPYVAALLRLDLGVLMLVDVHQQDVTRGLEEVVELRSRHARHREHRLHLRQAVHVRTHGLTHRVRHFARRSYHQTLVDRTRSGSEQPIALSARYTYHRDKRKKEKFFHNFVLIWVQNYINFTKNAKKMLKNLHICDFCCTFVPKLIINSVKYYDFAQRIPVFDR